ncbi:pirin family protein [Dyadobacter luteus]|uniref:Pirin family protein n=1 Tax=Dyadobacter luteus TaxID=2259619 RepID=A0A3D8Y2F9_9BACT|nr:pirin family protein [Dyadobacter luteus]REA55505.1 pirin family protein [Dyadobacter luteus]
MNKKSSFSSQGQRADIGELIINRVLPNRYADAVGPIVFLDHIVPQLRTEVNKEGTGAHAHRGIATLTYILDGEDEHFDSAGNYAKVHSGGIQWMKAASGIIHDETLNSDSKTDSEQISALQFWINLPAAVKAEKPAYLAIEGDKVPLKILADELGWIKVIAGSYQELHSEIPGYSEQFIYHIQLQPGAHFKIDFEDQLEVGVYLPTLPAKLNNESFSGGEFIEYDRETGSIELFNENTEACDYILFGGQTYTEPIVAEGPFVMSSKLEIAEAYKDFFNGKYGQIDYQKQRGGE